MQQKTSDKTGTAFRQQRQQRQYCSMRHHSRKDHAQTTLHGPDMISAHHQKSNNPVGHRHRHTVSLLSESKFPSSKDCGGQLCKCVQGAAASTLPCL